MAVMKFEEIRIGQLVEFVPEVYGEPYAPHYDRYRDQRFQVAGFEDIGDMLVTGVWVECVSDPSIEVEGFVLPNQLVPLN
jgi:hypothetical protein